MYSAIWSFSLTNVKWYSDPRPTATSQPIRIYTNFMTLIPTLTFTELWVVSMDHLQRVWYAIRETLTLLDTWFPLFWDLLVLQLLRPDSLNFPCLYSTFCLGCALVLSRFCLTYTYLSLCLEISTFFNPSRIHRQCSCHPASVHTKLFDLRHWPWLGLYIWKH